jgi:hypothetical protein
MFPKRIDSEECPIKLKVRIMEEGVVCSARLLSLPSGTCSGNFEYGFAYKIVY